MTMRLYYVMIIFSLLTLSCVGAKTEGHQTPSVTDSSHHDSSNDTSSSVNTTQLPEEVSSFTSVIDSLRNLKVDRISSQYCLYDISEDGTPELWAITGSCEADSKLYVYTLINNTPIKIFEDAAGHACFSKGKGKIINFTCYCGGGYLKAYEFKKNKFHSSKPIEFSMFNEEGEPKAIHKRQDKKLQSLLSEGSEDLEFIPIE